MITIPYTIEINRHLGVQLVQTLLAVYAISIKKKNTGVYIAVLTYVTMIFCLIQHILEAL